MSPLLRPHPAVSSSLGHCSHPTANWPRFGWRAVGKDCQRESPLQRGGSRRCGGWEVGLDGARRRLDQPSCLVSPAAGPRGASVPRCVSWSPRPEDHKGCNSKGGLKHLKTWTSGKLTFHPVVWSSTSPQGDGPREGVRPVFVPDPCPTTAHPCPLDGEQRDAAHTDPALVTGHGGRERPAVRVRVVHLHRAQVGLSVIAPHGVEPPAAGHQRDPAPAREHGHDQAPLVRHRAVHLGDAEEA